MRAAGARLSARTRGLPAAACLHARGAAILPAATTTALLAQWQAGASGARAPPSALHAAAADVLLAPFRGAGAPLPLPSGAAARDSVRAAEEVMAALAAAEGGGGAGAAQDLATAVALSLHSAAAAAEAEGADEGGPLLLARIDPACAALHALARMLRAGHPPPGAASAVAPTLVPALRHALAALLTAAAEGGPRTTTSRDVHVPLHRLTAATAEAVAAAWPAMAAEGDGSARLAVAEGLLWAWGTSVVACRQKGALGAVMAVHAEGVARMRPLLQAIREQAAGGAQAGGQEVIAGRQPLHPAAGSAGSGRATHTEVEGGAEGAPRAATHARHAPPLAARAAWVAAHADLLLPLEYPLHLLRRRPRGAAPVSAAAQPPAAAAPPAFPFYAPPLAPGPAPTRAAWHAYLAYVEAAIVERVQGSSGGGLIARRRAAALLTLYREADGGTALPAAARTKGGGGRGAGEPPGGAMPAPLIGLLRPLGADAVPGDLPFLRDRARLLLHMAASAASPAGAAPLPASRAAAFQPDLPMVTSVTRECAALVVASPALAARYAGGGRGAPLPRVRGAGVPGRDDSGGACARAVLRALQRRVPEDALAVRLAEGLAQHVRERPPAPLSSGGGGTWSAARPPRAAAPPGHPRRRPPGLHLPARSRQRGRRRLAAGGAGGGGGGGGGGKGRGRGRGQRGRAGARGGGQGGGGARPRPAGTAG
jgi:hypothetical protein